MAVSRFLPGRGERSEGSRSIFSGPCPDLLHPEPQMRIDAQALEQQLAFAFAGGDCSERISALLGEEKAQPSTWDPTYFAHHLFIESWVTHLASLPVGGRPLDADPRSLERLLTHPPSPEVLTYRHKILGELVESPEARKDLTEIYRELRRLRGLFLRAPPEGLYEGIRRRIEVLDAIKTSLARLARSFYGTQSGLESLRTLVAERVSGEAFSRLIDLLEHDHKRALVSLEVRLGGDGRIRELGVKRIEEATQNRFHRGPVGRFFSKLGLWARGYRFADEELIDRWIDSVYADFSDLLPGLLKLVTELEFYLCALAFRDRSKERGLAVCLPEFVGEGQQIEALFNPLLLAQGITPIPCDLKRPGPGSTTIITGPNSGGKTRLLQSIGLAQLLAQCGFFVPAARARLLRVPYLFCSLIQEDTYDQSEGRLGTELLRIRRIFERAPPGALIIIDELCSGTNPSEVEEIFLLVISLLAELGPETFVTTHFLDFATGLELKTSALELFFLQVELDGAQHPTFAFVSGVAKTSLATQAASRLGVTRDELLSLVRKNRGEHG